MFVYEEMKTALNERIPEVIGLPRMVEIFKDWDCKEIEILPEALWIPQLADIFLNREESEIPTYLYYETLEELFHMLITKQINDEALLNRVLVFMEDMAESEDIEVSNLMQVQILESVFGLDYDTFAEMESKFLPKTRELFQYTRQWFNEPSPQK